MTSRERIQVSEIPTSESALSRPTPQIVELAAQQIYDRPGEVLDRLGTRPEIILIRGLQEAVHVRELILNQVRRTYSEATALRVEKTLFERKEKPDEHSVIAFAAAARHIRDTGAMSALFSRLIYSFQLPQPVNIDCGHIRMVLPNDLFARMQSRRDLTRLDDVYNPPPHDGTEPIFTRSAAMPHRDISRPYYAFQFNMWFPLFDLAEHESLMFFPDSFYNYKERVERLSGSDSQGFEDDVRKVGARIAANPNPSEWGFGKPASRKMAFGDVYMFYSQQVHGSPIRKNDTLRLSIELRAACRSWDDNTGYRRIFSNLNNFLPCDPRTETSPASGLKRADALASWEHPRGLDGRRTDPSACAQLYLNSLFPSPLLARRAKEIGQPAETFDLAAEVNSTQLKAIAQACDRLPFADDRYFLLARLYLRRDENDEAAALVSSASRQSQSYFWQLHFAHLAIRAHRKDLARKILARCRLLAERAVVDAFPFAPKLDIPGDPIIALLPDHALRATEALSKRIDSLPDDQYGPEGWYPFDPRLFHPHAYFVRTNDRADFYRAGMLFLAIPAGQTFVPEDVVNGKYICVCFGETMEELEYEYKKHQNEFPALAPGAAVASHETSMMELEQRLRTYISERLKPVEEALEERTGRINSLETALEERNHRLKTVEADLQAASNAVQRTISHRLAVLVRRLRRSGRRVL